ncbi:MAG: molecular chaperone TorD family protein [Burkholderiaceae bacterium]
MNQEHAPLTLQARDEGEELQRAELYGLLARLWLAPPDAALLEQFQVAVTEAPQPGSFLEAPWQDLVSAMRATSVEAAAAEFEALFVGIGKPDVLPYGSQHLAGALNEKPLVALRSDLAELQLARDPAAIETEDHLSFLFEVMRYLIAGDDLAVCNLERQRRIFRAHIQPWVGSSLADAVIAHPRARLYAALATFTRAFVEVEAQGFDMIE